MQKLTILVGIPASGKSSYSKKISDEKTIVLSSDAIRKELLGSEEDQSNNNLIFKTLYARAIEQLKLGKNVVIDSTNVTIKDRARTLKNFDVFENIKKCVVCFETPIEECIKRDSLRSRKVGAEIIRRFAKLYQRPSRKEGFDEIKVIKGD